MIGILFATQGEARPFLTASGATPAGCRPFPWYRIATDGQPSAVVGISGMGKVAATMAAACLVLERRVSMLVNAGLCGRLTRNHRWSVGDLFRIRQAVEGDCDRFGEGERSETCQGGWFRELPAARLVTCDRPVFEDALRSRLARLGDLADMEGAAVARVAACWHVPCAMLKGISDDADGDGRDDLAQNMDRVARRIGDVLMRHLRESS